MTGRDKLDAWEKDNACYGGLTASARRMIAFRVTVRRYHKYIQVVASVCSLCTPSGFMASRINVMRRKRLARGIAISVHIMIPLVRRVALGFGCIVNTR